MAAAAATSSMVATIHRNTLLHFRFNPEYTAQRGRHGEGSNRTGHEGESFIDSGAGRHHRLSTTKPANSFSTSPKTAQTWLAAKGGRGGRGNARFATATHQAPTEHEDGKPGEFKKLQLEAEAAGRCRARRVIRTPANPR